MEFCHWNDGHYGFFKDSPFFSDMEKLKNVKFRVRKVLANKGYSQSK